MKRKRASEIFGTVDPNLRVIEGHRHLNKKDWKRSGGAVCPRCGKEAVRFRHGVCITCAQILNENLDRDEKKRAKQLKFVKAHNARIDKRKGSAKHSLSAGRNKIIYL